MTSQGYCYLASPYSHPDEREREGRFRAAMNCAAWLLRQRLWTYSPIVHCHELAIEHDLPFDFNFWREYNFAMLRQSRGLYVLMIAGWRESKGVQAELQMAAELEMPVTGLVLVEGKKYQTAELRV